MSIPITTIPEPSSSDQPGRGAAPQPTPGADRRRGAPRLLDGTRLGVPGDRVAYIGEDLEGAYTTGPIAALQAAIRSGRLGEARTTLMLAAGAGITVALALYRQDPP